MRGLSEIDLDPEKLSVTIESDSNTNIEYRLQRTGDDSASLILFSKALMTEPLFQFRVEVKWDRNVVARSYDVFIDPPSYASIPTAKKSPTADASNNSDQSPGSSDSPATEITGKATPKPIVLSDDVDSVSTTVEPAPSRWLPLNEASSTLEGLEKRRNYGPTIDGNSIWRVARAVATDNSELNIYQWMYSIWKSNPDAFYRTNMHRLNMGEVLNIPFEHEVAAVNRREAWRSYSGQLAMLDGVNQASDPAVNNLAHKATDSALSTLPVETLLVEESVNDVINEVPAEPTEVLKPTEFVAETSVILVDETSKVEIGSDLSSEESMDIATVPVEKTGQEEALNAVDTANAAEIVSTTEGMIARSLIENAEANDLAEVEAMLVPVVEAQVQIEPEPIASAETSLANPPMSNDDVKIASGWRNSLAARQQLIAQLPLIGADAPLASLGRALHWFDEYIATSPSWVSLAFGIWLTIVVVMLSRQFRQRSLPAVAVSQVADRAAVRISPAPVMAPVPKNINLDTQQQSRPKAPAKLTKKPVERKPTRNDKVDFNADEILNKAEGFLEAKNSDEAVKLLELAIKLQPGRVVFVVRLLEIFHKLKRAAAFELLLERFRPVLNELDRNEQLHLQAMYGRLCPMALPLIDPQRAAEEEGAEAAAPEAESRQQDDESQAQQENNLNLLLENDDEEEYLATQVMMMNNGVLLDDDSRSTSSMVDKVVDLEDTLNEIDVYLAYGLYDSAEELILKGLEIDPNRVDFLAKLLDTYYATKNLVDFISYAESLRDMGEEVNNEYWDKVEVMGFELAPYNELFAGGKNKSIGEIEVEITKPVSADFDLGNGEANSPPVTEIDGTEFSVEEDLLPEGDETKALESDLNLDLDDDELDRQSEDEVTSEPGQQSVAESDSMDDLVDGILSDYQDDDPTNLNFVDDPTRNVTFDQDEPILMEQLDDDEKVEEEEDRFLDLEQNLCDTDQIDDDLPELDPIENEAGESQREAELDLDQVAVSIPGPCTDTESEDTMRFTIADESKLEATMGDINNDLMDDTPSDNTVRDSSEDTGAGQILFFPDHNSKRDSNEEFEAEVKTTLQAIRDQLQYMTERLYRQERETIDLRQELVELRGQDADSRQKSTKK